MRLGIIGNITKPIIREIVPDLLTWLKNRNTDFVLEKRLVDYLHIKDRKIPSTELSKIGEACDLVLAFGGDGTILSTARAVASSNVPILGVNLGGLGFLAEVSTDQLYSVLENILNSHYKVLERMAIKAEVSGRKSKVDFIGLNDIVVDKGSHSRVMRVEMLIDDEYLTTYLCDGVIIATPTGSTAYSLSAFGPILTPDVDAIVINPISPHSLGARPVVIPGNSEIKIIPSLSENKQAMLSADGQVEDRIKSNEEVIVRKANFNVQWIQYEGNNFFEVLRTKLNWGGR